VDLRLVMSLERLWRFIEFLDFDRATGLCTSSEVMAVPGWTIPVPPTPMWRPISLGLDLCLCRLAGIGGIAGMFSSSVSPAPLAKKLNRNEFPLVLWLETVRRRLNRRLKRFALTSVVPSSLVGRRRSLSGSGRQKLLRLAFLSLSVCRRGGFGG
jgi:hypothetical protein